MFRIGILNTTMVSSSGGGFHYLISLIEGLKNSTDLEIVVFYDDPTFRKFCFEHVSIKWIQIKKNESQISKLIRGTSTFLGVRSPLLGRYKILLDYQIDLLITFDSFIGVHLGIPFLSFIGDVMYKYYPELPEYPFRHRWIRNLTTKRSTKYAELVIVDSEESKKDLIKFFGVPSAKLRPIRLCAPPHIFKYANGLGTNVHKLIAKHHIPSRFIFYPAQFWSHKNHANLVRALDLVRRTHSVEIPAVFVGSAQESYESLQALIKELGMDHQVHCLGYLPEEEVVALYKKAIALVFASFADYTSIPVVEAMVLGTPIVCSRIFSLPEQVGDAGVFFDPFNVEDMAEAIYRVWADEKLRQQLAENGRQRADELSPENFRSQWMALIHEALENGRG